MMSVERTITPVKHSWLIFTRDFETIVVLQMNKIRSSLKRTSAVIRL